MKIQFTFAMDGKLQQYTSPEFPEVDEEKLENFFDWCGDEGADEETFWSSDVSQDDDTIVVDFSEWPKDPQRIVTVLAQQLGVLVAPFSEWEISVDRL
jgi:hypothetical protein